jgi:phosphoglycerate dehydrogenase-like enzyme
MGREIATRHLGRTMKYKIAVLDDYQNVALGSADWSVLSGRADITVFQDHLDDTDAVIERLLPFDIICVMRERTPLPRDVIVRLPNLKFIASTGPVNASIDVVAAADRGIVVSHTGYNVRPSAPGGYQALRQQRFPTG